MDLYAVADDAARRHGVDPALVRRVLTQETGGRAGLVSPKGARGPMQLMPGTARDLGVDPDDPVQNIDGGVRYLKQQLTSFGTPELALAAYNAGPGTVRKYGGVPPYAETQKYVRGSGGQGVDGFDGSDIFGMASQAAPDAPGPAAAGAGDFDGADIFQTPAVAPAPKPPPGSVRPPQMSARRPADPTIAQDTASGFMQPFKDLGNAAMSYYQRESTPKPMPRNPLEFGKRVMDDMGSSGNVLASVLGLAGAPVQAVVRPTARAINRYGPTPNTAPQLSFKDGRPTIIPGHPAHGEEAQGIVESALNTALSGAMPAKVRAPVVPRAKPASLDELRAAKTAAYKAVDTSGFTFKQVDLQGLAKNIVTALEDAGGPELNEQAAKMVRRVQSLAERGDLSLSQLDKLRGQVGEKVIAKGEPTIGYQIRDLIDGMIDGANVPEMRAAREANMRFKKVEDVINRIDDAELNKAASGTGSNTNTARQALKPLVKKKSPQLMKNATPAEMAALKKVVRGGNGENVLRILTAFDPTAGKLRALLNTGAAGATHGLSALAMPVGMAASAGEKALQTKNIQALIDLMSTGGVKPTAPPAPSLSGPFAHLPVPTRLLGAGVVATPIVQLSRARPTEKASARPAQPKPRQKSKQR